MDDNPPINIINRNLVIRLYYVTCKLHLPQKNLLPGIGHHFVTPGNIQMGRVTWKIKKLVKHGKTFATHYTMKFLCKCVFFKHIIGIYGKLNSFEVRPEDSHSTKQKTMWGISDFHNLSTTMASDVTHICKILMSKLDRKPESKWQ